MSRLKWTAIAIVSLTTLGAQAALDLDAIARDLRQRAESGAAPVCLVFWQTHNLEETKTLKEFVAEFERDWPAVDIQMEYVNFDDARDKFKIVAQAGQAPDVMRAEIAWTPEFADLGYLREITDFISEADLADFLEGPLNNCRYDDDIWGLPQVTDCLALLYNKRLFAEAGIAPPETMDEFITKGKLWREKFPDSYMFSFMASDSYFFLPFLWAFGGDLIDVKARKPLINSPASVQALQFLLDLKNKHHVVPSNFDIANDYENRLEEFKVGKLGSIFMGPWATASILSGEEFSGVEGHENLGIARLPSGPAGGRVSPVGGHNYVISADCPEPEIAYFFIHYLDQPRFQARFATANNLLPTRRSTYQLPEIKNNPIVQAFGRVLAEQGRNRPVMPEAGKIFPDLNKGYQEALRGAATPQKALDYVARAWKEILDQGSGVGD